MIQMAAASKGVVSYFACIPVNYCRSKIGAPEKSTFAYCFCTLGDFYMGKPFAVCKCIGANFAD